MILKTDPNNSSVLINLGVLYGKTHRLTEAIDSYRKAFRVVPSQGAVQLDPGQAYLKQERYAEALPWFAHLHKTQPGNAQVTTLYATALDAEKKAVESANREKPDAGQAQP